MLSCLLICIVGADCVRMQCNSATKTLGDMPAKCCRVMDPRLVLKHLENDTQKERFQTLFSEYRTEAKERVYCPNNACGQFISQYQIRKQRSAAETPAPNEDETKKHDSAIVTDSVHEICCPSCSTPVCLACKQSSHEGSPCQIEDDPVFAQISKFGYKRCPRCGFGTRRMWGCSHMQCVCGAHWCWSCERNYAVCDALGGCEDDEDYGEDDGDEEEDEDGDESTPAVSGDSLTIGAADGTADGIAVGTVDGTADSGQEETADNSATAVDIVVSSAKLLGRH
jgi:hypothetical protein